MSEQASELTRVMTTDVRRAVKTSINKFREHPEYFFTEGDIHSYFLIYCIYRSQTR